MKQKYYSVLFLSCLILILNSPICFAARSGISKPIQSYTCDDYYDVIETEAIENNIYNYYQNKKMELTVTKKITSQAYIEQIREFILEDWTPPFNFSREEFANKFDKAFDDIYIVQVVDFDFRSKFRNAIVVEEAL